MGSALSAVLGLLLLLYMYALFWQSCAALAGGSQVPAQCGRELGGLLCDHGLCCSQYGFCGSTDAYCGAGCQSQCDGVPLGPVCGKQAGGRVCPNGLCCSSAGRCGTTAADCGSGCQSQCAPPLPGLRGLSGIVSQELFQAILPRRNSLYTYSALLQAAQSFPAFATSGDEAAQRREVAAFFAHATEETSGLFYVREIRKETYCDNTSYPCYTGKQYYGRLKWNYNYGRAGSHLGLGLGREPDLLATNSLYSFQASLWLWMTALDGKPSCHEVMTGEWAPQNVDREGGRFPGFGLTTNILNGPAACGQNPVSRNDADRVASYQRIAKHLSVDTGLNLHCNTMLPFRTTI